LLVLEPSSSTLHPTSATSHPSLQCNMRTCPHGHILVFGCLLTSRTRKTRITARVFNVFWRWGYPFLHLNTKMAQFSCPGAFPPSSAPPLKPNMKMCPCRCVFVLCSLPALPAAEHIKHTNMRVFYVFWRRGYLFLHLNTSASPRLLHTSLGCFPSGLSCTRCHHTCKMCPHGHIFHVRWPLATLPSNWPCPSWCLCTLTFKYENPLGVFVFTLQHHKHVRNSVFMVFNYLLPLFPL